MASKYRLAEWPMYAMLLWSLKAAMAVFYMRLTVRSPWLDLLSDSVAIRLTDTFC